MTRRQWVRFARGSANGYRIVVPNSGSRTRLVIIAVVLLACAAGAFAWWRSHRDRGQSTLLLYGNVDFRQAELPFNNSERIAAVLVQEGDVVHAGQVIARLDTSRLEPQLAQAIGQLEAQRQAVERLRNGSRPEEIAQSRANLEAAKADQMNAQRQYQRLKDLFQSSGGRAISQQDLDNAKAALDVAEAKVAVNQKTLDLLIIGPRKEDIAQAEAQFKANEAQVGLIRREVADAQLVAPRAGVVRARLMEPGEMASPLKPVISLAIIDPKWVRAYVSEPDLGHVRPGMAAQVAVDSFPDRRFDGWVGFISPVAEFTPKPVQTQELRTSLVYEVRVFVKDPADELRLGMPATVFLPMRDGRAAPARATVPTTAPTTQPQP